MYIYDIVISLFRRINSHPFQDQSVYLLIFLYIHTYIQIYGIRFKMAVQIGESLVHFISNFLSSCKIK